MTKYKITTWHGENYSVHYVVDINSPEDEQPAIAFSSDSLRECEQWIVKHKQENTNADHNGF